MQYIGSKNKIAKHILPIILNGRKPDQWYVEPFVGGANMIDKVSGLRIGSDVHPYLIALLKALQLGWLPPTEISEEQYADIKKNPDRYDDRLVGFAGFQCAFGGKWMGTYAKNRRGDNYAKQGYNNMSRQAPKLEGVIFKNKSYDDLDLPPESIIYCDPPYGGTYQYGTDFDSAKFWQWCRDKTDEGHAVYVSEYAAPDDFTELWSVEHRRRRRKRNRATNDPLYSRRRLISGGLRRYG